jgi:hypothetical protein
MSPWAELHSLCRALQQCSAKRHEEGHITILRDGWNPSNHNRNYLPQVLTFHCRILCFEIRELNLQALSQRWENYLATCKVLPSGTDLAACLGSQSYGKTELMRPQTLLDRMHPDGMIKDLRVLINNT